MRRLLSPLRQLREPLRGWFSLTRSETSSLLLVLGIILLGFVAKLFWLWRGE
jgi:hypothetical protein